MNSFEEKNKIESGTLYLVATPIGNLADLSERAVKVLSGVDYIAAEDTRNSKKLLDCVNISPKHELISYHDHNRSERGKELVELLKNGASLALITDAGTPAISDPGEDLVVLCANQNIPVTSIPGCCASIVALTLSGLSTHRFTFEGFLSTETKERCEHLDSLKEETRTMLFHEAPHKLLRTLNDFQKTFGGDRRISLCKELTKTHENIMRTTIAEALAFYMENEPKGEYVLVVEGYVKPSPSASAHTDEEYIELVHKKTETGLSKNEAIKQVAKECGLPKNDIYRLMIQK